MPALSHKTKMGHIFKKNMFVVWGEKEGKQSKPSLPWAHWTHKIFFTINSPGSLFASLK